MSRKDFISDHLVDMRAQLRDSYTSYHQSRASKVPDKPQESDAAVSAVVESAGDNVETSVASADQAVKYLPTMRAAGENTPDSRERRDLEGRIIHDLAAIDCQRDKLRKQLEELEKFSGVLTTSREQIAGKEDVGKVGMAYFAARGRWSAFEENYEKSSIGNATDNCTNRGFWIIAGAVLTGSLIVAFALIKSFSV